MASHSVMHLVVPEQARYPIVPVVEQAKSSGQAQQ